MGRRSLGDTGTKQPLSLGTLNAPTCPVMSFSPANKCELLARDLLQVAIGTSEILHLSAIDEHQKQCCQDWASNHAQNDCKRISSQVSLLVWQAHCSLKPICQCEVCEETSVLMHVYT